MINKKFEAYKIEREIKRNGSQITILRMGENAFGEPSGEPKVVGTFNGLYHEQNSSVSIVTGDTTQIRTKKVPSVLCLYSTVGTFDLQTGDIIHLEGSTKEFNVTGVVDIQEWHIILDVSLEILDVGK